MQINNSLITHPLPPVWSEESRVLLLGTMPSPQSRSQGFYYMHPQNRFWRVLPLVFGETLAPLAKGGDIKEAVALRRDFLLRHKIALWDVLASCQIKGAADSTIRGETANDFTEIFERSKISRVFFTGKTASAIWKKHCAHLYEKKYNLACVCLPSTSPANACFTLEMLVESYKALADL